MEKIITYCGEKAKVVCDERCNKAWGIKNRPKLQLSDDIDEKKSAISNSETNSIEHSILIDQYNQLIINYNSAASDIKEIISDDKACGYIFEKPYKILTERSILLTEESEYDAKIQISLSPWIILAEDDNILVSLDSVITVVEPIKSVKEMYEEKVNGKVD